MSDEESSDNDENDRIIDKVISAPSDVIVRLGSALLAPIETLVAVMIPAT